MSVFPLTWDKSANLTKLTENQPLVWICGGGFYYFFLLASLSLANDFYSNYSHRSPFIHLMCKTAGDGQILSRVFLLLEVWERFAGGRQYPNILAARVSVDAAASPALQKRRDRWTEDGRAARRALSTVVSSSAASLFYISRLDFCETSAFSFAFTRVLMATANTTTARKDYLGSCSCKCS